MKTLVKTKLNCRQENSRKKTSKKSPRIFNADLGHNLAKSIDNWRKNLIDFDPNYEPKISERKDRYGNTYFRIYDPINDRFIYLNSEEEVRYWLDKRYYL